MRTPKLALLLAATILAAPGWAAPLYFTYADFGGPFGQTDWTITFTIDSNQAPDAWDPVNVYFPYTEYYVDGLRTDIATGDTETRTLFMSFFTADGGGGLEDNGFGFSAYGPQVFTGTVDAPVFQLGTFYMTDWTTQYITSALLISADPNAAPPVYPQVGEGAVPEPASWALMVAGFGLAGAAMRHQRRVRTTFA